MILIGFVSSVWDKEGSFDGQVFRNCGFAVEGLPLKGGGKLVLPEVNRQVRVAIATQGKIDKKNSTPDKTAFRNEVYVKGWEYVNGIGG